MSLTDAAMAHELIEKAAVPGKIVLIVSEKNSKEENLKQS
jgi:hypothetical protein